MARPARSFLGRFGRSRSVVAFTSFGFLIIAGIGEPHGADHVFLFCDMEQPHSGAATADDPQPGGIVAGGLGLDRQANELGLIGYKDQLLTEFDREARDNRAVAGDVVDVGDPLSAASGAAIFIR